MPRPLTLAPSTSGVRALSRRCTSSERAATWASNSRVDQNFSSATVAVTKAWALPRNVPLCSPGFQLSQRGRMHSSDIGSP